MKILSILLLFSFSLSSYGSCKIKDPKKYHKKYFEIPGKVSFVENRVHLNSDEFEDLIITTDVQCGTRGCEYSLYKQVSKEACFEFLGDITGRIVKVSSDLFAGSKIIYVQTGDGYLSVKKVIKYFYDPVAKKMKKIGR